MNIKRMIIPTYNPTLEEVCYMFYIGYELFIENGKAICYVRKRE